MESEILYMLGVVAVGFVVNYALRALPFVLFAGKDRELPRWVERLGNVISPVIIAGLIVYSYSGLEWRTAYPYLAGFLTVALQLWKRNPLMSIVAGTVLYMCLLSCGCSTRRTLELDAQHPTVRVSVQGVLFGDVYVRPDEVVDILEDYDVPHSRTVHILLDSDVKDLRLARFLMATLAKAGYTRPMLVSKRRSEAYTTGKKAKRTVSSGAARSPSRTKPAIRYKKSDE